MNQHKPLAGCRVLVIEDEYLLAERLLESLNQWGATVIGPIGNLPDALHEVTNADMEMAVVDINLGGEMAYPLAQALRRREVPFVFATGYEQAAIPLEFAEVTRWEKPFDENLFVAELARIYKNMSVGLRVRPRSW